MAKVKDEGHEETEVVLASIEKKITKEYAQAEKEVSEKLDEYLRKFAVKDNIKRQAWLDGKITKEEYEQWRLGQIAVGKRWEEMKDSLAQDYTNAAEIAKSITDSHMPEVYAINHNYGTFQVEKAAHVDTSYTLYDTNAVERLFKDDNKLYHDYGIKVGKSIKEGKQLAWDKKQIQSVMTQSLLQGESIGKIATRLSKAVGDTDRKACIRNARTMATGVQNAGRVDSYKRAENMGIDLMQEWLATLDSRTRHEHRMLDGQRVKVGEKFKVDGYELAFPADPEGEAFLVYNCRCTLVPVLKGFEVDSKDLSLRNTNHMEDETYDEWKESHNITSDSITKQDEITETMQRAYGREYAELAGSKYVPNEDRTSMVGYKYQDDNHVWTSAEIEQKHGVTVDISKAGEYRKEAEENVNALGRLLDEYNSTIVHYSIVTTVQDAQEGGSAYMLNGKTSVTVGVRNLINRKATDELGLGANQYLGTTYHEFAHSLSQSKEKMDKEFWKEIRKLRKEYQNQINTPEWFNGVRISSYASKDVDEFMAEAFTQAKLSNNPSEYAMRVLEIIDKYYKKK